MTTDDITALNFYSHTPHGVQQRTHLYYCHPYRFLLTHPSRGATQRKYGRLGQAEISTHTPLTGCNVRQWCKRADGSNFYSHTPHGVQRKRGGCWFCPNAFLLTHPSRGATLQRKGNSKTWEISTHTPLTGCNSFAGAAGYTLAHFYSHTPHGVQPQNNVFYCKLHTI